MLTWLPRFSGEFLLAGTAMFQSAFLLFAIEPMIGKILLPWFGGSSAVWASSLLFFSTTLFAGYAYVVWLTRLSPIRQLRIHSALALVSVGIVALLLWGHGTLYAPLDWTADSTMALPLLVVFALATSIGLPFLLLSSTGPLIQYWYAKGVREPYKLYALSNLGSLLALIAYPFAIEPLFRLSTQQLVWGILFAAEAGLILYLGLRFSKTAHAPTHHARVNFDETRPWVLLSLFPAFMLVATTTEITQVIAPIPLLWILPLCVYLLSFIAGFASSRGRGTAIVGLFLSCAAYALLPNGWVIERLLIALCALAFLSWYCHGRLYDLRPKSAALSWFYLCIGLGGMLGTFAASILAPLILSDFIEFRLGLAVAAGLVVHFVYRAYGHRSAHIKRVLVAAMCGVPLVFGFYAFTDSSPTAEAYYRDRNFYGTIKIVDTDLMRSLYHGTTLHGLQYKKVGIDHVPNTYYASETGVGRAIMHARSARPDHTISVGVIGLGAGAIAAYCVPGDRFAFYEIDPQIEKVAREHFSYLDNCAGSEVHIGDGRILLDRTLLETGSEKFDILIVDAFSDDTIPVHLLTKESLATFTAHLKSDESILAVHISNRYLNLLPVLMAHAQDANVSLLSVVTGWSKSLITSPSAWVLLSTGEQTFNAGIFSSAGSPLPAKRVEPWSDDYSDILSVMLW